MTETQAQNTARVRQYRQRKRDEAAGAVKERLGSVTNLPSPVTELSEEEWLTSQMLELQAAFHEAAPQAKTALSRRLSEVRAQLKQLRCEAAAKREYNTLEILVARRNRRLLDEGLTGLTQLHGHDGFIVAGEDGVPNFTQHDFDESMEADRGAGRATRPQEQC